MRQIIKQHFQLEGIAQVRPRAAGHPIYKLALQLNKGGFHLVPHLAEDKAMRGGLAPGVDQYLEMLFGNS